MDTKEFLELILPREGVYMVGVATTTADGRPTMKHKAFTSFDEAAKYITVQDAKGESVYHACSAYLKPPYRNSEGVFISRKHENWKCAKAFWLDIDCGADKAEAGRGYSSQKSAIITLMNWCRQVELPTPYVVSSGYGVHAYWVLTEPVDPTKWSETAVALKNLTISTGLLADPTRTADFASILRPVGTFNRKKPESPQVVRMVVEAKPINTPDFIRAVMNAAGPQELSLDKAPEWIKADGEKVETIKVDYPLLPSSAKAVANHCKQVALMRDTKGDVSYEHWRGVIGLIKHCVEGVELAREWSENRASTGHESTNVQMRYDTWNAGPTSCAFFGNCNPDGCEGCKHKGITSPIELGRVMPEPKEEVVEVTVPPTEENKDTDSEEENTQKVVIPALPAGYDWDGKSMVRLFVDEDGVVHGTPFCPRRIYLTRQQLDAEGGLVFTGKVHFPEGTVREFQLAGALIGAGSTELMKFLGKYGVVATNHKDAGKYMHAYLKDFVNALTETTTAITTHGGFGWQSDGSFLIGDRLYKANGSVSQVLLAGLAKKQEDSFPAPVGTVEEYAKSLNWIYNRDGMEPLQYMICSLIASPLAQLCESTYNGIPCALTGASSGKGKTTACFVGLYAYGRAVPNLCIAGAQGATVRAQATFLGTLGSLPMVFDEITNMDARSMSSLCYSLSNGVEPMRLRAGNGGVEFSNRESWRLHTAITGNTSIKERLSANGNVQAEAMRVLEINVDEYNIPTLDPLLVAKEVNKIEENLGCAGHEFVKYVVSHKKAVKQLILSTMESFQGKGEVLIEPRYRFFRNHVACTLAAAKILKDELHIIDFDLDKLANFAVGMLEANTKSDKELAMTDPMDALERLLDALSPRIFTTERYMPMEGFPPYTIICPQGMVGRAIRATNRNNRDKEFNNTMLVSVSAIKDWCVENRVNYRALRDSLIKVGAILEGDKRFTLGKGTTFTTPQQRCWLLDLKKIQGENDEPTQN